MGLAIHIKRELPSAATYCLLLTESVLQQLVLEVLLCIVEDRLCGEIHVLKLVGLQNSLAETAGALPPVHRYRRFVLLHDSRMGQ